MFIGRVSGGCSTDGDVMVVALVLVGCGIDNDENRCIY